MQHFAKKSLGQNFLKNEAILNKIIEAANLTTQDVVLEIGPGLGALTEKLIPNCKKVVAIEKDDSLFETLSSKFATESNFNLQNKDILEFDPEEIGEAYKLVANIPYNITGAIIEKFLSTAFQPEMMVLMVQKEVAERIVAKDKKTGGPGKESILSIAVKAYGNPTYIGTVKAGNFVPAPSIDSAIIKISNISRKNFKSKHHEEVFFQVMKAGFAHKRKTLSGNLKNILEPEVVEQSLIQSHVSPNARAEDLGISDWLTLAGIVYTVQYGME
jgi:16S rRNA (adenine1518-N6/adenine1519-N6)-dimethyltransferase